MSGAIPQYGDLACALLWVSAASLVPLAKRLPPPWRVAAALIVAILSLVEIHGVSLAGFVRGAIGDPAVTTSLLLLARLYTWAGGRPLLTDADRRAVFVAVAVAGAFLYPMALGLGRFDPYALGYSGWPLAVAALALTVLAIWRGRLLLAWLIVVAVLAYDVSLLESQNLWNYFIDPLIVIYWLIWGLRRGIARWKAVRHSGA